MTEEEAREKLCPQLSGVVYDSEGDNSYLRQEYCVASGCMMWRWNRYEAQAVEEIVSRGDFVAGGYCGLTK